MIAHSEQQLTTPTQGYMFRPASQQHGQLPQDPYAHDLGSSLVQHNNSNNNNNNSSSSNSNNIDPAIQRPSVHQYPSYDGEPQGFEHTNGDQGIGDSGATEGRKKKGNASTIANDIELKKLFRENVGRSLHEVAAQVLANERGPRSEKTKQIFAMLW